MKGTVVSNLRSQPREREREREREIKCGGMIDDHDKRKFQWWAWMSRINWEVEYRVLQSIFKNSFETGRYLWSKSRTTLEKKMTF